MLPDDMTLRRLTVDDLADADALRVAVGWGSNARDFRQAILWGGEGCFAITHHDRLIATTTTIQYGQARAWVGMVIVHPDYQGHGLGTTITKTAIDYLCAQGIHAILLGATVQGRPVYEKLGFLPLHAMKAWMGVAKTESGNPCRPMTVDDLPGVMALDEAAFGVNRAPVIQDYFQAAAGLAWCDGAVGQVEGYVVVQPHETGRSLIGPWMHCTSEGAERLLKTALSALDGRDVRVNIPDYNEAAQQIVLSKGLEHRFTTTRMIYVHVPPVADFLTPEFGTASPAIG